MTDPAATSTEVPSAREVRAEIRDWRRGRAELRWGEVLSDGYIALFCVVMIGAMGGNVVLTLRRLADDTCVGACSDVRSAVPWLVALAVALLALGLARLLGPVFSPPAANAWLLSSPVDRGALLRPGWWRTAALTVALAGLVLLAPAVLGGFSPAEGAVFLVAGGATALACVGIAALSQVHEDRRSRWLTWAITAALWSALGLSATHGAGAVPGVPFGAGARGHRARRPRRRRPVLAGAARGRPRPAPRAGLHRAPLPQPLRRPVVGRPRPDVRRAAGAPLGSRGARPDPHRRTARLVGARAPRPAPGRADAAAVRAAGRAGAGALRRGRAPAPAGRSCS